MLRELDGAEHSQRVVLRGRFFEDRLQHFTGSIRRPAVGGRASLTQQRIGEQYRRADVARFPADAILHLRDALPQPFARRRRRARHADGRPDRDRLIARR